MGTDDSNTQKVDVKFSTRNTSTKELIIQQRVVLNPNQCWSKSHKLAVKQKINHLQQKTDQQLNILNQQRNAALFEDGDSDDNYDKYRNLPRNLPVYSSKPEENFSGWKILI